MRKNNPISDFWYNNKHYSEVEKEANESNRIVIIIISSIALPILLSLFTLSFRIDFLANSTAVYGSGMVLTLVCLLLVLLSNKKQMLPVKVAVYLLSIGFLAFGLATSIVNPEQQSVSFHVILLIIPCVFVEKPGRMFWLIFSAVIVFLISTFVFDSPEIRSWDLTNGIAYGSLSLVIDLMLVNSKIKRFSAEKKVRYLSSTDVLTGLKNRNNYENFLEKYNPNTHSVRGCVFVDVNGLHELNNTKGHKAGDDMLKAVADKIVEYFVGNNLYRIGGDEFLIIVTDHSLEESTIQNSLKLLKSELAAKNYFISVGYCQNGKEDDIVQTINHAEKEMYSDKKRYYEDNQISDRRQRIDNAH